jgi:hypothetical protein
MIIPSCRRPQSATGSFTSRARRSRISRTVSSKVLTESLHGIAELEGGERLAVVGLETDQTTPIEFHLRPISDTETKYHWLVNIGFRTRDREFDWKETFWISGHCTRQYLDDLLAAVRRGYIDNIRVDMETTMWTRDPASPFGGPTRRTWHLTPPPDGGESTEPELAHGNISSLTWEEKFAPHEAKDEATPKPQLVELPARVYSMLTAPLAIAAALLVLTFLRH